MKSVAIATGHASFDHVARGREHRAEVETRRGQQACDDAALGHGGNALRRADDQVLSRDRADLTGELAAADGLDLVGVDLGTQAILETRFEHLTGLFDGEGVGLAEDVAELGDALLLDLGHHLLAHKADVLFAVGLIFRGDKVRAHEGRDEVHAVVIVEVLDDLERLELMLGGQGRSRSWPRPWWCRSPSSRRAPWRPWRRAPARWP